MPERDDIYYDFTISLCPVCLRRIGAKIVFQDNNVYMLKNNPQHGFQKVLVRFFCSCRRMSVSITGV